MQQRQHLGIYALIFSDRNRLLLIKKSNGPYTGTFDLPGGTPDFGETPQQTVQREVREETGLDLSAQQFHLLSATAFCYSYTNSEAQQAILHHSAVIFCCRNIAESVQLADGDGIDSAGAFWASLPADNLSPLCAHVLNLGLH